MTELEEGEDSISFVEGPENAKENKITAAPGKARGAWMWTLEQRATSRLQGMGDQRGCYTAEVEGE